MLEEACNICLDTTREEMHLWENVYVNFNDTKYLKWAFKTKDWPIFGGFAKTWITRHLSFIYEVTTTFIICLKEAKEILDEFPIRKEWIK